MDSNKQHNLQDQPEQSGGLETNHISEKLTFTPDIYLRDMLAKENEVWIGTHIGLYRYNKNNNTIKMYENLPNDPNSLSQNYLTSLAINQ